VGNSRRVLVSELSGASNIAEALGEKFNILQDRDTQRKVLQRVQELEHQGYQFEAAIASFELLLWEILDQRPSFWRLDHYRCSILRIDGDEPTTEATVKLRVGQTMEHHVAEGDGPVNALDGALRKCLEPHLPQLQRVRLRDYKVRVVNPSADSAAKVRVTIDFAVVAAEGIDTEHERVLSRFTTIGVSENIVDASWMALVDAFDYHLIELRSRGESTGQEEPTAAGHA
jgi:2-isopropylmalate synthase